MTVQFYDGKVLFHDGKVVMDSDLCCDGCIIPACMWTAGEYGPLNELYDVTVSLTAIVGGLSSDPCDGCEEDITTHATITGSVVPLEPEAGRCTWQHDNVEWSTVFVDGEYCAGTYPSFSNGLCLSSVQLSYEADFRSQGPHYVLALNISISGGTSGVLYFLRPVADTPVGSYAKVVFYDSLDYWPATGVVDAVDCLPITPDDPSMDYLNGMSASVAEA